MGQAFRSFVSYFRLSRSRALWRKMAPLDRVAAGVLILLGVEQAAVSLGLRPPFESLSNLLLVVGIGYFVVRLLPWLRKKLLWSLRNRLILAYIFIAVVPVALLLTMAGIASYMMYLQLGAHILHDALDERLGRLSGVADAVAQTVATDVSVTGLTSNEALLSLPSVAGILRPEQEEMPGLRLEVIPEEKTLHGEKQVGDQRLTGLVEAGASLWLRAVASKTGPNGLVRVSASIPMTPEMLDSLGSELGPIQITLLRPATAADDQRFLLNLGGVRYVTEQISSRRRVLGPPANLLDLAVKGVAALDVSRENAREPILTANQVFASFLVRPSQLNHFLFTSLGALGSTLTLLLTVVGLAFLLLELAALYTGIVLTRRITGAVADLYEATRHVRKGDFRHRVRVQQRDQLGVLGESFNEMTSAIAELIEEQRRRQYLENELSIAREVQSQLFPKEIPQLPGVELSAICRAARIVSGDYYDFIRLGPAQLGIAIADISGKGISAALLMASLQAALRSQALLDGHRSTADLVSRLNQHLFHNTSDDRYATLFYATYDSATRTLSYTNAGHVAPLYVEGGRAIKLEAGGTVVGLFDECEYEQKEVRVSPGGLLVAFSDGLTEPENVYGEEYGARHLLEEIHRRCELEPSRLAADLISSAEQWGSTPEQADDMTVLVARFR